MLDLFADYLNQIEQGLQDWPAPLKCWRQALIPKPGKDHSSLDNWRPISVGSVFYRVWSAIRIYQLQAKILQLASTDTHGGISKRGTHTALTGPLCELQRTQSLQANGILMAQIRPALRYLGTADLTKAFDKLHYAHATASALQLGFLVLHHILGTLFLLHHLLGIVLLHLLLHLRLLLLHLEQ